MSGVQYLNTTGRPGPHGLPFAPYEMESDPGFLPTQGIDVETPLPVINEKNYLFSAAGVGKFWRSWNLADKRNSDPKVLQLYEPYGWEYFRATNINKILEDLLPDQFTFQDIQYIMERIFHAYGTREANKFTKIDEKSVAERVALMNELTVEEVRKYQAAILNAREINSTYFDEPNVQGHQWLPSDVRIKGAKLTQNIRYIEPKVQESPFPFMPLDSRSGLAPKPGLFDIDLPYTDQLRQVGQTPLMFTPVRGVT